MGTKTISLKKKLSLIKKRIKKGLSKQLTDLFLNCSEFLLHIKPKVHNVAVLHYIFFTFHVHFTGFFTG